MTRYLMKSLLAAAVAASTFAPLAEARDRAFIMQSGSGNSVVLMAPKRGTISRDVVITQVPSMKMVLNFDCVVAGTPVEFPNDIRISNPYNFTITAGTVASYSAPFGNSGTVVLPALAPGKFVHVSNAVPGGITAGASCSASSL